MVEHNPEKCGCKYIGFDAWSCGHIDNDSLESIDEQDFDSVRDVMKNRMRSLLRTHDGGPAGRGDLQQLGDASLSSLGRQVIGVTAQGPVGDGRVGRGRAGAG